jgi:hypothetical protein
MPTPDYAFKQRAARRLKSEIYKKNPPLKRTVNEHATKKTNLASSELGSAIDRMRAQLVLLEKSELPLC